jgi:signal peptidase II
MLTRLGPAHVRRILYFGAAAVTGGGCDLQTKSWAETTLGDLPRQSMSVVEPWLDFTLAYNRGTAFSMIRDLGVGAWIFGALALAVVVALVFMLIRTQADRLDALALGAVAGGAVGNGLDRLFREAPGGGTGVVDFVQVNYPWGGHWPLFNVADALLVVGVAVLMLRRTRKPTDTPGEPAPAT